MSTVDETFSFTVSAPSTPSCTIDNDCSTGQICQNGKCVTPFNWMQIGILAILGVAVVLVATGIATTKD